MLLRAAKLFKPLAPIFNDARRYAGVHPKAAKCEVVMICRRQDREAREAIAAELNAISPVWGSLRIGESGKWGNLSGRVRWRRAGARHSTSGRV